MYAVVKRIMDVFFSFLLSLVLLPLFLPVMIGLLFTGEREVFYRQKRIGHKNKYFDILKFATMLKDSPNIGTGIITLRDDPRVTPMGTFLRKTKINELPQIFNVLLGDLSLVGPRPLVDRTFNSYVEDVREKIYDVKPGITGIGSVVFRDEERLISNSNKDPQQFYDEVIAPYKGALEMWYLKNISFVTDFKILFLTAWAIVFPDSDLHNRIFKNLPKYELPDTK